MRGMSRPVIDALGLLFLHLLEFFCYVAAFAIAKAGGCSTWRTLIVLLVGSVLADVIRDIRHQLD